MSDTETTSPLKRRAAPAWVMTLAMFAVILLAIAFRLPALNDRVFHGDEANNAFKFKQLWYDNDWRYDPHEYHGPTLFYMPLPVVWLSGVEDFESTSESTYRVVTALCGVLLVWLTFAARRWIGTPAAFAAAVFCAVSPAFTYYSRYFIHETPLVLFTLAAMLAGFRYIETRRLIWAVACGVCLALVHATKETCILAYFAMVVGVLVALLTRRPGDADDDADSPPTLTQRVSRPLLALDYRHVLIALAVAVAVSVTLFSSFFTNPRGPLDSVLTYMTYLHRGASGEGAAASHINPWHFYLSTLAYQKPATGGGVWWSEGLVLALAVFGLLASATGVGVSRTRLPHLRFLAVYTVVLTAVYSVISYKTPWSMLGFYHGWILMAGVGVAFLVRITPSYAGKGVVVLLLCAGTSHLGWQAYRANFVWHTNTRNPYFYAHAVSDVRRLADRAHQLADVHPDGDKMLIRVISHDYWPLPFYLRDLERVGYYHQVPGNADAPMIIVHPGLDDQVAARIDTDAYNDFTETYGLRPSVFLIVYIRKDLWGRMIEATTGTQ